MPCFLRPVLSYKKFFQKMCIRDRSLTVLHHGSPVRYCDIIIPQKRKRFKISHRGILCRTCLFTESTPEKCYDISTQQKGGRNQWKMKVATITVTALIWSVRMWHVYALSLIHISSVIPARSSPSPPTATSTPPRATSSRWAPSPGI